MEHTFVKAEPGDFAAPVLLRLNRAQLKRIYNALVLDSMSDGKPLEDKQEILETLKRAIDNTQPNLA